MGQQPDVSFEEVTAFLEKRLQAVEQFEAVRQLLQSAGAYAEAEIETSADIDADVETQFDSRDDPQADATGD